MDPESAPIDSGSLVNFSNGNVAQTEEHMAVNHVVMGSIPSFPPYIHI